MSTKYTLKNILQASLNIDNCLLVCFAWHNLIVASDNLQVIGKLFFELIIVLFELRNAVGYVAMQTLYVFFGRQKPDKLLKLLKCVFLYFFGHEDL